MMVVVALSFVSFSRTHINEFYSYFPFFGFLCMSHVLHFPAERSAIRNVHETLHKDESKNTLLFWKDLERSF